MKKEKHIHTFAMVFPPLQEATSFVVKLQFFPPMWAVTPSDIVWALHLTLQSRQFSQLMP